MRYRNRCSRVLPVVCATLAVAAVLLAGSPTARAATLTWDPLGTLSDSGGTWTTSTGTTNWYNGTADTYWTNGGTVAVFGWGSGGTAAYTVTLGSNITASGITFSNQNYTIAPGNSYGLTISSASGITTNASANINSNVTLGYNGETWTTAANQTLTVGGTISGTGQWLYAAGAGTLAANGPINTYLSVNSGALVSSGGGTLYSFDLNNNTSASSTATFTQSAGSVNVSTTSNAFSNATAASTAVWNMSGGTMTGGAGGNWYGNNATGATTIYNWNGGTANWLTNIFLVAARGTSTMNLSGSTFNVNNMALGLWTGEAATVTVNLNAGSVLSANQIAELSSSSGAEGSQGAVNSTFNFNGGTIAPTQSRTDYMQYIDTVNVQNGGAFINTGTSSITIPRALLNYGGTSTGGLTLSGSGVLTLSGNNTYAGDTVVSGGTLTVGTPLALQDSRLNYNGQGGTLSFGTLSSATFGSLTGSQTLALANTASAAVALSVGNNNGSDIYSGILSGSGSLTKVGSGMLTLSGSNTFSGNTTVSAGSLDLSNSLALQNSTLSGGSVVFDPSVAGNAFTLGGLSGSSNMALLNNAATPAAIALSVGNNNANTTYSGVLSSSGSLIKIGSGTLTFTGSNTYSGGTTISAGSLQIGAGSNTGWLASLSNSGTVVNNGTLVLNRTDAGGNDINVASLSGTGSIIANAGAGTIGFRSTSGSISAGSINATSTNTSAPQSLYGSGYATGINLFTNYITTTGNQTYNGVVSIGRGSAANPTTTLTSTGGSIGITGGVVSGVSGYWSAGTLVISTSASNGAVLLGGTTDTYGVGNLNIYSGTGNITLTGGTYGYEYSVLNGPVVLTGNASFSQGQSQYIYGLDFKGTVNSGSTPQALTLTIAGGAGSGSGTGTTGFSFEQDVGTVSPLASASINASGYPLNIDGKVITTGAQTYQAGNNAKYLFSNANMQGSVLTFNDSYNIGITGTWTQNFTAAVNMSNPLYGSGGLLKAGTNMLTLSGSITYSGGTTISGGTLDLNTAGSNSYGGGQININGPSTLEITQSGGIAYYGFGGKTFNFDTVGGGTIAAGSGVNWASTAANTFQTNGGARDTISGPGGMNLNATGVNFNVTRGNDPASDLTVSAVMSNSSVGLSKTGNGILTLTAANSYTGGTTISAGTLQLGDGATSNGSVAGNIIDNSALGFANPNVQSFSGTISGPGVFSKSGSGTLTLSAANYTGNTSVNAGALVLSGGTLSPTSAVSVANSATFGYSGSGSLTVGSLTFSGAGGLTLTPNGSVVPLIVSGSNALTPNGSAGSVLINIGGSALPTGVYSLVDYAGTIGGVGSAAFALGTTPVLGPRDSWTIVNNPANPSLDLDVTTLHPVWTGATSTEWSTNPVLNWTVGGGTATAFLASDVVSFPDLATSAATVNIANGNVTPNAVTFTANTTGYTLTGTGGIADGAGPTALVKSGSGQLTINTANSYSGGTSLAAGLLNLGNAAALGSGPLAISGGSLDNTTGSPMTLNNAQAWSGSFTFVGSSPLNVGTGPVTLSNAATVTVSASTLTVGGPISGGGSLTTSGGGTLLLTAANTYTGGTTIASGILQLGDGATANGSLVGNITDNGVLAFANPSAQSFAGTIGGTGSVLAAGMGTLTLSGTNSYSGGTTLAGGTVQLGNNYALGTGAVVLATTGNVITTSGSHAIFRSTIDGAYPLTINSNTGDIVLGGNVGATTPLTSLSLTSAATATTQTIDPTYQRAGPINVCGNVTTTGNQLYNGAFTVGSGVGIQTINLTTTSGGSIAIPNGVTSSVGSYWSANTLNINTSAGNGNVLLGGTSNTYGLADLNVSTGTGTTNLSGGSYSIQYSTFNNNVVLRGDAAFAQNGGDEYIYGLDFNGTVDSDATPRALNFTEAGSVGYTSGTGTVGVSLENNVGANSPLASVNLNVANGPLTIDAKVITTGGQTYQENGDGGYRFNNATMQASSLTFTDSHNIQITGTWTQNIAGNVSMANPIFGSGSLDKAGTNSLTLTGASSYSGQTTINSGTLQLGSGGNSGSINGSSGVADGGTLAFNRSDSTTFAPVVSGSGAVSQLGSGTTILSASNSYSGQTTIAHGTLTLGSGGVTGSIDGSSGVVDNGTLQFNRADNPTFAVAVSGSGGLRQSGQGVLAITASNTYSGATVINSGTLQLGNGGTSGSIDGTNGVVDNGTLQFNRADNLSFAPAISGTGGVNQVAGNVLTLTGSSSYSGPTNVSAGTLHVAGALGNTALNVAGGATLSGFGSIGGSVNVANQGTISLVDGPGDILTLTGAGTALTLNSGAALDLEIGSGIADQVALTAGNVVLNGSIPINLTGATISAGTYNLITSNYIFGSSGFVLDPITGLPSSLVASLATTGGTEQLIIAPGIPNTAYWTGATDASWSNVANWALSSAGTGAVGALPGSISDVYFTASTGQNLTTTLNGDFTVKSLNFTATSGAVTISGTNTLTIATTAGISDPAGAAAQTINANVALAAPQTWTVNSASPLAVGGVISGASTAGLTLAGSGTVILTAANTYSGGTTINAATLQLGDGVSLNGSLTGNIADNGLLVFVNPNVQSYTGTISGTGGVVASGSGVLTFNTAHTYAGGTTVNANATLQLGDGLNLGSVTGNISDNGLVNFNNPLTQAMTGTISGNGGVTKTAAGLLTLSAANSYSGGTTVTGGTLNYGVANALPSTGAVTINGGQLNLNGQGPSSVGAVTLASGSIAGQSGDTLVGSSFNVQSGAVSVVLDGPTAGLTKTGDGTAVLSAANTYAGGTTVSGGQLQYGAANALPTTGAVLVNGGQLDLNGQGSSSVGDVTLQSGSITGQSGDTLVARSVNVQSGTVSANLGGGASLVKSGPGTVVLSGNNSYAGGTSVGGGVLAISGSSNLGPGNLTLGAGTLQTTGQYTLDASTVTLTDATAGIDTPNSADVTLTGLITGGGGLNKTGPGTLELAGAAGNNYVGDTSVQAGTLIADTDSALSPTSTLVIGDGASVILNFGGGAGTDSMPAFAGVPAFAAPTPATPALSPAGISTVPEPGTLALLLVGAMSGLMVWRRRS